jgi:hypothetical protein
MSTKTTFKRIALVAVAALGLGVLSVAPSSAAVTGLTVTVANGTSTLSSAGYKSDSTTAGTIAIAGLLDSTNDSVTVTFLTKSAPATATATPRLYFMDTTTPTSGTIVETATAAGAAAGQAATRYLSATDSWVGVVENGSLMRVRHNSTGYVGAKFAIQLDTTSARIAGTYTYTVIVKAYGSTGGTTPASTTTADVSIVVADTAANVALVNGTIAPSLSTAWINAGSTYTTASDSAVAAVSTASATPVAAIRVRTYTVDGNLAPESVTVTVTGPGLVVNNSVSGKSISLPGVGGDSTFTVIPDGTAGTASIVVKTTSVTFPAKTVTFYAKAAKTITVSANKPVIGLGESTDVVRATALDANGSVWGGAAYIVAATAADALIAGSSTPVACTFNATKSRHECPVSGTSAGTANFKVIDASTVALATATSDAAAVRVSVGTPTTAKIAFDKATYNPGEKALVSVTILDAAGLVVPAQTVTNAFAADIVSSVAFSSGNLTGSASPVIVANTDLTVPQAAGTAHFVVYMPFGSGDVTLTATGSTGLALAGRVAVSATASVVNTSVDAATDAANEATDAANAATDAALAAADAADAATAAAQDASDAVAALSATVAKLVASLKAQITSLTNLVIKIQKKVRA